MPFEFKDKVKYFKKHLSVVSFKPKSLISFGKSKISELEKIEDLDLLRAIDIGLKIKTINLKGDSFSIDIFEDYKKLKFRSQETGILNFIDKNKCLNIKESLIND